VSANLTGSRVLTALALLTLTPMALADVEPRTSGTIAVGPGQTVAQSHTWPYEGGVSVSAALFRRAARHLAVGAEIGYHQVGTAFSGLQCGPEWGVDCPGPEPRAIGLWELSSIARLRGNGYRFHPYTLAGIGAYLAEEPAWQQFQVRRNLEPGVTFGFGLYGPLPGGLGIEGRWYSVWNGDPQRPRSRLDLVSARATINIP